MSEKQRSFYRGEVFYAELKNGQAKGLSPVIYGGHRVVVLFNSIFPSKTVTVVPISSRYDKQGNEKPFQDFFVELHHQEYLKHGPPYNGTIKADSMIKTDQITTISRDDLESKKGEILPEDMIELDVKMIVTLGLKDTINTILQEKVQEILSSKGYLPKES